MANPVIRSKRSSVQGKIPTVAQLSLGELAINTFDGKVFLSQDKSSVGIATTVIAINPWSVGPGTSTYNTYFTSGNVGVGTTIVNTSLDVIGNHYISGSIGIGSTNPMYSLDSTAIQIRQDSGSNQRLILRGQPGSQYRWNIDNFSSSNNFRIFREDDSTAANGVSVVGITSTNNFGLGTLSATSKLHVVGDARITGGIYDSNNNIGIAGSVLSSTGSGLAWAAPGGGGGGTPAGSNGAIQYRNSNSFAGATQLFYDSTTNNTGVGITLPTSILHVVGNTLISGIATATTFSGTTATFTNLTVNGGITGAVNNTGVGTVAYLQATTVNVSAAATIPTLSGTTATFTNLTVNGGITGAVNNTGVGTIAYLQNTNINSSGIATATTFSGTTATFTNLTVNGGITGAVNNTGVGTIAYLQNTNINSSGIATATTFSGTTATFTNLTVNGGITGAVNNTGVGTIAYLQNTNINSSGIHTASSFSGSGANLTALNGSNISSGIVTAARLGGNGTASASTYLRGDGTWSALTAPNNGTLTLAVSGTGLSGSASFTADQSSSSTFTVTSNATNANTASAIVARDASGNFSAGTITATSFSGSLSATTGTFSSTLTANSYVALASTTGVSGNIAPLANNTISLGNATNRWANVFSNDLDLCNEGGSNNVDGTWGSYLIQEGVEDLFLINRRNGKKYKFLVQEVQ